MTWDCSIFNFMALDPSSVLLTGRVAVVTGGGAGIGRGIAAGLTAFGARVAIWERDPDSCAAAAKEIGALGIPVDVRDSAAVDAALAQTSAELGPVTILVNNAGIVHSGRAVDLAEEDWRRVLATNLDAVFYWAQEAARRMLAAGKGGAIINIASVLGMSPDNGVASYATAKAGVIQLTKALAIELAFKGIRVNAIAPGWIVTEINRDYLASERGAAMKRQIPMGRFGEDRDLDGPLLLLASDAGRFMTGATIVADGGQVVALRI